MLQSISVAMFCLTLTGINTISDLSCDGGDLRTIMIHVRQMQTEYKELSDVQEKESATLAQKINDFEKLYTGKIEALEKKLSKSEEENVEHQKLIKELKNLINETKIKQDGIVQEYNNSEELNTRKLEAVEKKLKNSKEETAKLRTLIQNLLVRINASESEEENQQNLIIALQNRIDVLQQQVNESEAKISEQSLQIKELEQQTNESKADIRDQNTVLDQTQERLNGTNSVYKNLQMNIAEINLTLHETVQRVDNFTDLSQISDNATNGGWSLWSSWSTCSLTCTTTRNRSCDNPAPSAFGLMCEGNSVDIDNCAIRTCAPGPPTIRLIGERSRGRLEVSSDGINWGTVCDDEFDDNDAKVVCRMLGYLSGAAAIPNYNVTDGTGPIFMDDLRCQGSETSLFSCIYSGWSKHNCQHTEDVGVACW